MAQMGDIGQFPAVGAVVPGLDRPSPRDDELEQSSQIKRFWIGGGKVPQRRSSVQIKGVGHGRRVD